MEGTVRFSLNTIDSFRHTAEDLERKLEALVRQVNGDKDEIMRFLEKNIENGMVCLEAAQKELEACDNAYDVCEKKLMNVDRMIGDIEAEINRLARAKSQAYDALQSAKSEQTKAHNA